MQSLRTRLTLTHTLAALVAVVIVAVLTTVLVRRGFDQLAAAQAGQTAAGVAGALERYYAERGTLQGAPVELRRRISEGAGPPRRVLITGPSGRVIFDSRDGPGSLRGRVLPPRLRDQAVPVRAPDGSAVALVLVPFSGAQEDLSQVEREFLARVYFSVVAGSVIGGAVAFGAGMVMAAHLTRPLRRLTGAARRLAGGERHEPIAAPHTAELDELARSFNTMAAELERQQHLRRQLVADIAHELRTPLSVLRLQIESIEDGVAQPTPAVLASLGEEVGLLTRLVEDLRLLSLADAGQLSLNVAPVDAAQAVERAAANAAARARQQGVTLNSAPAAAPLIVLADQQRLGQILGNLVENALRYTPSGGSVSLSVARQEAAWSGQAGTSRAAPGPLPAAFVVFAVRDTGPGIPPQEQARIFERFYRTDQARTRETGGTGLGLAIVQRLAEMQGGRVWIESAVGSGTTCFVALPEAREPCPPAPPAPAHTLPARR